jgi:nucleoside 2-deoxyribosyltransferase
LIARKIYLASSWRNKEQPTVLATLRELGHEVYDFCNPAPGNTGFSWRQCQLEGGKQIDMYDMALYVRHITTNHAAQVGFKLDRNALNWCDTCVLLLPCGRSAHLEAGYAIGRGKETFIVLNKEGFEPELMYLLSDHICETPRDLIVALNHSYEQRCKASYG